MTKHKILTIALPTFLVLLILSILYFKERTAILDISYHLFNILKDKSFAIQNNRFGAFFTQLFPLISSKMGLPLSTIALLYSVSFVLLPLVVFLIITLLFKNIKVGLAYFLFVILMTTHTFYWIQSELPQAMAFLFLFLALLDNQLQKETAITPFFMFVSNILLFIICFTHPLAIVPFCFMILYFYTQFQIHKNLLVSIGANFLFIYAIKSIFFKTNYDSQSLGGLKNVIDLFPNYFNLQSNKNLFHYILHDYYFLAITFLITIGYFLQQKQYLKFALVFSFFVGYTFLINISYPNGADQFYIENQYLVLAIFVGVPLAYEVLPSFKHENFAIVFVSVISFVSLFRIYNTHQIYTNRLDYNRRVLSITSTQSNRKIILPLNTVAKDTLMMTWASSYEFWVLSAMENKQPRSIIIEESAGEFDWAMSNNKCFLTKWGCFDYSTLSNKYFNFADTSNYVKSDLLLRK